MNVDLGLTIAARITQILVSVVALRIMTGVLDASEMGKYSLIMSAITFFALTFINPIGTYINRKTHYWYENGVLLTRLKVGAIYLSVIVLLSVLLLFIGQLFFQINNKMTLISLIGLIAGFLFLNTINQTIIPSFNMLGEKKLWALFSISTLIIGLFFSVIFTHWQPNAEAWISGQLVGFGVGALLGILFLKKIVLTSTQKQNCKSILHYHSIKAVASFAVPVALTVSLNWVQFQSYRFTITNLLGMEYLGYFVTGYTLSAGIMGAFETTAINYFYPIFYKRVTDAKDGDQSIIWKEYASLMIPLVCMTVVLISCMSAQLIHILVDKAYWTVGPFVIVGSFIEAGRVIGNVYSLAAHAIMKTKILVVPQLIGAGVSVISVLIMGKSMGANGVATALLISALLYVLTTHICINRYLRVQLELSQLFFKTALSAPILALSMLSTQFQSTITSDCFFILFSGCIYLVAAYIIFRRSVIH